MSDILPGEYPPYDIDPERLRKGARINAQECERVLGIERHLKQYDLELFKLRNVIEGMMLDQGESVTVCQEACGIAILTDSEASTYGESQVAAGIRKIARAGVTFAKVDHNALDEAERRRLSSERDFQRRLAQDMAMKLREQRRKRRLLGQPEPPVDQGGDE